LLILFYDSIDEKVDFVENVYLKFEKNVAHWNIYLAALDCMDISSRNMCLKKYMDASPILKLYDRNSYRDELKFADLYNLTEKKAAERIQFFVSKFVIESKVCVNCHSVLLTYSVNIEFRESLLTDFRLGYTPYTILMIFIVSEQNFEI
ncbi:hypothetical protein HZS_4088, partial [Henneguya salminicola]